jgi:hypothetical protein
MSNTKHCAYYITPSPDDKKVEPPVYVRRLSARKYEYGRIDIDFVDRRKDAYVAYGTATSYAKACTAAGLVPAQPNIPAGLRPTQ